MKIHSYKENEEKLNSISNSPEDMKIFNNTNHFKKSKNKLNYYDTNLPKLYQNKTQLINNKNSKNLIIKTDILNSNSDHSYSSTYNSSARNFLLSEPKISKFNSFIEQKNDMVNNKKKNSTLSLAYSKDMNNYNKNELPELKSNRRKNHTISERNDNMKLMKYIKLNSCEMNEPIKISYVDDNPINNNNNNKNNKILLNKTFDKEFNIIKNQTKIKKNSFDKITLRKNKIMCTMIGYKNRIMKLNSFDSNKNKMNKRKKIIKLHYNSDDGINIKTKFNKIHKQFFKEKSLKNINNLSKISENINKEDLNKSFSKLNGGKEKIKQMLLGKNKILNDNSNECDYEYSKSESETSKKELKSINSCLKMNMCLSYKEKNIKKIKKYKQYKIFEEGITDKLNIIKKNTKLNKEKILKLLQNNIYNAVIESKNKIKEKRKKKSLKTLKQINKIYIPLIIKENKQNKKIIKKFEKLYFHLLMIKTFVLDPNIRYIKNILLSNYFLINIPHLILKIKYLEKETQIANSIIVNFNKFNQKKKLRTIRSIKRPNYPQISIDDLLFIDSFYKKDLAYKIKKNNSTIKIISNGNNINQSNHNNNKNSRKSEWKFNFSKQNLNHQNEKHIKGINSLLTKNEFYTRLNEHKKNNTEKLIVNSNNIYHLIEPINSKKKKTNNFINKNDLNNSMIKSFHNIDLLFFHIKNKNYYGFKNIFEKYKLNPDLADYNGNSLLILAVKNNCFQIANYLLNVGASVNYTNKNNNTPLHFAFTLRNFEIADMLIRQGANEKIQNKFGILPWECLDSKLSII